MYSLADGTVIHADDLRQRIEKLAETRNIITHKGLAPPPALAEWLVRPCDRYTNTTPERVAAASEYLYQAARHTSTPQPIATTHREAERFLRHHARFHAIPITHGDLILAARLGGVPQRAVLREGMVVEINLCVRWAYRGPSHKALGLYPTGTVGWRARGEYGWFTLLSPHHNAKDAYLSARQLLNGEHPIAIERGTPIPRSYTIWYG